MAEELLKTEEMSRVYSAAIGQPLCTIIQIALVDLLASWNVRPEAVTGHSSGEIAAAYACGSISLESAVTIAYHRGLLAANLKKTKPGVKGAMLAVALSREETQKHLAAMPVGEGTATIACVNSPLSVTVSGDRSAILRLQSVLEASQVSARRLQVDTAYHSYHMKAIAEEYRVALGDIKASCSTSGITFSSSVKGTILQGEKLDSGYWVENLLLPVRFTDALQSLCFPSNNDANVKIQGLFQVAVDAVVEIGPHAALARPISQILAAAPLQKFGIKYFASLVRSEDAIRRTLGLAGDLFKLGCPVDLDAINFAKNHRRRQVLTDLPPYPWDHSSKYWHESRLSQNYRQRTQPRHHLLGAPSSDCNLMEPQWRNILRLSENPWLRGHVVQSNIVFPAAGYIAMALEASRQRKSQNASASQFHLRDIHIGKALFIPESADGIETVFVLRPYSRSARESSSLWDEFRVFSYTRQGGWEEHCRGLISVEYEREFSDVEGDREIKEKAKLLQAAIAAAKIKCTSAIAPKQMYDMLEDIGLHYGTPFTSVESVMVEPHRSLAVVRIPNTAAAMPEEFEHPSILHPATFDSCLQVIFPALYQAGTLGRTMVPTFIEGLFISGKGERKHGDSLSVLASTSPTESRGCRADITATSIEDDGTHSPMIEVVGLVCSSLSAGPDPVAEVPQTHQGIAYMMRWEPDLQLLAAEDIVKLCVAPTTLNGVAERYKIYHSISHFFVAKTLAALTGEDEQRMKSHHIVFLAWMKQIFAANKSSTPLEPEADQLFERCIISGPEGQMLCRVGQNMEQILKGDTEPLSIMMEDDLLYAVYQDKAYLRCYDHMARFTDMLGHKSPGMDILEIGAGTGGATVPLLRALTAQSPGQESTPRLRRYHFTDISSGFFEKAEELLEPWSGLVNFQKLNIEMDPQTQGFSNGSYDMVVASQVLHATSRMDETMQNVRNLLRPGGRLLLVEVTHPRIHATLIFGTLPGWWLGKISYLSKFSLVDQALT